MSKDTNEGGFISHLVELRKRLINTLIFISEVEIAKIFIEFTRIY